MEGSRAVRPAAEARRRTRVRRILWWGLGILGALVLLGVIGVWALLDSASCTSADPEGQRLLESQAIEDVRPAGAELAYDPSGPACSAMFAGPWVLEPERSWYFDAATESSALEAAEELIEAAEEDSWSEVPVDVPEEFTTDEPAGSESTTGSGVEHPSESVTRGLEKRVEDRSLRLRISVHPPFGETNSPDEAWTVFVETTIGRG